MLFKFQGSKILEEVSVINAEGPPVPIPNTEVKLCSGENTLRETVREDSSMLTRSGERRYPFSKTDKKVKKLYAERNFGGVAQLGEHLPCKQGVMGSNPIISTSAKAQKKVIVKTAVTPSEEQSLTNHKGS